MRFTILTFRRSHVLRLSCQFARVRHGHGQARAGALACSLAVVHVAQVGDRYIHWAYGPAFVGLGIKIIFKHIGEYCNVRVEYAELIGAGTLFRRVQERIHDRRAPLRYWTQRTSELYALMTGGVGMSLPLR